jgi:hypothetical protein
MDNSIEMHKVREISLEHKERKVIVMCISCHINYSNYNIKPLKFDS